MVYTIQRLIRTTDAAVAAAYLAVFRERSALLTFLFHSLFEDERQICLNVIDPLDRTTVERFRQFVAYYVAHGYRFIGPEAIAEGLAADGKYALLTFDDGYFNNRLALPVLEELGVPALFFISTENVRLGKCFWWDVLYRERVARRAAPADVDREREWLKTLTTERIEQHLVAEFGGDCLSPRGDIDRPFTPNELREFSRHRCVRIGNHTANHAILTNYSPEDARRQVAGAQEWLAATVGADPGAIAYPNGAYNGEVVRSCRDAGLTLGFTVRPRKTSLPLDAKSPDRLMCIGRFTPHAESAMDVQGRTYRSDVQLYDKFRSGYLKLRGRQEVE